jgi:DNA mismatch endonuclease (patch repair protein)
MTRPTEPFASSPVVRKKMQAQRVSGTAPELCLRRELHRRGLRYRVGARIVPGTRRRQVDVAFTRARVAVFVDGCFWHACPEHAPLPPSVNAWYWEPKRARNIKRDLDTTTRLIEAGWRVLRIWEHEHAQAAADRVEAAVRSADR